MSDKFSNRDVDRCLAEMRAGSDSAFERLYDLVYKPLFALCFSYFRNQHDSEDALSEAFMTVKREIGRYNGTSGFNWIYTITKNICLKGINRSNRVQAVDFTDSLATDKYFKGEAFEVEAFDESGIITFSRKVLKDNEYEVLIYHAVYGMPFKVIANFMGKIEATVRWEYHNALNKIRKEYKRRYGENDQ